ncbi:DUF3467 domain-containing protein [Histidinibacterium lentulum]|uniref:DUF3467 domain-containing protein n=1 Tax=Histidinibacterium lentulum TaxID=2480588 RepID=A0A3N2QW87_9RHOB|nr:DUF3467 domain-containing protein [Histidinibacterium lentulum]ROT99432.1 DUF3467 domain-containing protein [Histidinibacterium lentulum]
MAKSDTPENGAADKSPGAARTPQGTVPPGRVRFDTSQLKSSYCNVCNGSSTREEVVINFGVNQNWDMGGDKLEVELHHRIVMSPFAAKRLRDMINRLIDEHESRYGKLEG